MFQSPVGATGGLEVTSITIGGIDFDIEANRRLVVEVPALPASGSVVHVRATALPLKTYYRMDALLPPGGVLNWPLDPVIGPWRLTGSQLGVFAWIEQGGKQITIPTMVRAEGQHPSPDRSIQIKLRSPVDLERVVWRELMDDGRPASWQPLTDRRVLGGQVISFKLRAGPPGIVQLHFRAQPLQSNDWLPLQLNVWRPAA